MLRFMPDNVNKILDVGCGAGEFGHALKSQRPVEVWGVELSHEAAKEAQTKLDKVIVGSIEAGPLSLPELYFDCIVFNDVLEHLVDPWAILVGIKAFMQPDCRVVASIPNVRYYDNIKQLIKYKQWKYNDEGILDKTHLRFFTNESIKDLFDMCGYKIISMKGIGETQFPWKFRMINQLLGNTFDDMKYRQFACVGMQKD